MSPIDSLCINTIRVLSADGVEKAKSGHPGMPMGCAAMGYTLWMRHLKHNPANPKWENRDRFVLSAGHGSMLLYCLLHLTGYDISLDDLKNFRQWGSKTPGHPEFGHTPGVETTTGPLGQGFANGVGMAIAQKYLAARYNKPNYQIIDYKIYAIVSDGDLMEGVTSEAASIASHLKLGNIIYLYDDNKITIEGSTDITFTEDVIKRFEAYGWHTQTVNDGNNVDEIDAAINRARAETNRPSIIKIRTTIGYGSPNKQNTSSAHGAPLGTEELKLVKKNLGFDPEQNFVIPSESLTHFRAALERGKKFEAEWKELMRAYQKACPNEARELETIRSENLGDEWKKVIPTFTPENGSIATRAASSKVMNAISPLMPGFIGGSADLAESTLTYIKNAGDFSAENYGGKNFHFGIREHAMGSIMNGMALTKGIVPYGATFLVFADYMRPAIRLASLMKLHTIYVFTHDSIGLGEDGPTHQPIEQIASLRLIPGLTIIRPADSNETAMAWKIALEHKNGPVALILSRQKTEFLDRSKYASADMIQYGAYILAENNPIPEIILIVSGAEVSCALSAYNLLVKENIKSRVVNMASWELFDKQPKEYRDKVLPPTIKKRLAIEAGSPMGWEKYIGDGGDMIAMRSFGASAPAERLFKEFGFSPENIAAHAKALLK